MVKLTLESNLGWKWLYVGRPLIGHVFVGSLPSSSSSKWSPPLGKSTSRLYCSICLVGCVFLVRRRRLLLPRRLRRRFLFRPNHTKFQQGSQNERFATGDKIGQLPPKAYYCALMVYPSTSRGFTWDLKGIASQKLPENDWFYAKWVVKCCADLAIVRLKRGERARLLTVLCEDAKWRRCKENT